MSKPSIALVVLVICALPIVALADWDPCCPCPNTKWVQHPDTTGWDVRVTCPKILADDFPCYETGWITDVHLWGSWKDDVEGHIDNIHLSIHSNIPDCGHGYSVPGDELWSVDINPDDYPGGQVIIRECTEYGHPLQGWYDPNLTAEPYIVDDHDTIWQVNILLADEDWFVQRGMPDNPIIYWLDVCVQVSPIEDPAGTIPNEVDFGWKTSSEQWNDDAVWGDLLANDFDGSEPGGVEWWNELRDPINPEKSLDLAFVITGIPIPEPGVLALAGLGLLALWRRRK